MYSNLMYRPWECSGLDCSTMLASAARSARVLAANWAEIGEAERGQLPLVGNGGDAGSNPGAVNGIFFTITSLYTTL